MTAATSPLKVLGGRNPRDRRRRVSEQAVLPVRARGARPGTAAHVGPDLVVAPLHALERDQGLVVVRDAQALDAEGSPGATRALDLALLRVPGLGASPLTMAADVAEGRPTGGRRRSQLAGRPDGPTGGASPARPARCDAGAQNRWSPFCGRTSRPAAGISGGVLVDPDGRVQGMDDDRPQPRQRGRHPGRGWLSERVGRLAVPRPHSTRLHRRGGAACPAAAIAAGTRSPRPARQRRGC